MTALRELQDQGRPFLKHVHLTMPENLYMGWVRARYLLDRMVSVHLVLHSRVNLDTCLRETSRRKSVEMRTHEQWSAAAERAVAVLEVPFARRR